MYMYMCIYIYIYICLICMHTSPASSFRVPPGRPPRDGKRLAACKLLAFSSRIARLPFKRIALGGTPFYFSGAIGLACSRVPRIEHGGVRRDGCICMACPLIAPCAQFSCRLSLRQVYAFLTWAMPRCESDGHRSKDAGVPVSFSDAQEKP